MFIVRIFWPETKGNPWRGSTKAYSLTDAWKEIAWCLDNGYGVAGKSEIVMTRVKKKEIVTTKPLGEF